MTTPTRLTGQRRRPGNQPESKAGLPASSAALPARHHGRSRCGPQLPQPQTTIAASCNAFPASMVAARCRASPQFPGSAWAVDGLQPERDGGPPQPRQWIGVGSGDTGPGLLLWPPLRTIYQQLSPAEVHGQLDRMVEQLREPVPQVAELLADAAPDILAAFPVSHQKLWSNNPQERLNREIRRRTDVVGIFPNPVGTAPGGRGAGRAA